MPGSAACRLRTGAAPVAICPELSRLQHDRVPWLGLSKAFYLLLSDGLSYRPYLPEKVEASRVPPDQRILGGMQRAALRPLAVNTGASRLNTILAKMEIRGFLLRQE